jgi:hypothetical protein
MPRDGARRAAEFPRPRVAVEVRCRSVTRQVAGPSSMPWGCPQGCPKLSRARRSDSTDAAGIPVGATSALVPGCAAASVCLARKTSTRCRRRECAIRSLRLLSWGGGGRSRNRPCRQEAEHSSSRNDARSGGHRRPDLVIATQQRPAPSSPPAGATTHSRSVRFIEADSNRSSLRIAE